MKINKLDHEATDSTPKGSLLISDGTTIFAVTKRTSNSGNFRHIAFYTMMIEDSNFEEGDCRITSTNMSKWVCHMLGLPYKDETIAVGVNGNDELIAAKGIVEQIKTHLELKRLNVQLL